MSDLNKGNNRAHSGSIDSYSEIVAHFECTDYKVMRGFMPEYRIEEPPGYWPVKTFAAGAMLAHMGFRENPDNLSISTFCLANIRAMQYQTPTYFVTKDLVAAALRTELPADLVLDHIHWPMPAMLFMLPRGSLRHETEGDAPFVCICNCPAHFRFTSFHQFHLPGPRIVVVTMMPETVPVELYHALIDLSPGRTFGNTCNELHSKFYFGEDLISPQDTEDAVILDSSQFSIALTNLGLTLISLISARPELVELGKFIKRVNPKHSNGPSEWWGPNILGKTYFTQKRSEPGEDGSSKRPHWVRGHLRNQPHGPRHLLRKLLWIEPYRTGGSAIDRRPPAPN